MKRPYAASEPREGRVPRAAFNPSSVYRLNPSWRVGRMEMVDPFGWHRADQNILLRVRDRLGHLERMTWAEILINAKKQNHSIPVADLCQQAQDRLEEMSLALEDVVSLRLTARERLFGYLEEGVLVLLWWDPLHEVCSALRE